MIRINVHIGHMYARINVAPMRSRVRSSFWDDWRKRKPKTVMPYMITTPIGLVRSEKIDMIFIHIVGLTVSVTMANTPPVRRDKMKRAGSDISFDWADERTRSHTDTPVWVTMNITPRTTPRRQWALTISWYDPCHALHTKKLKASMSTYAAPKPIWADVTAACRAGVSDGFMEVDESTCVIGMLRQIRS
jgi:hypothetical protein